MHETISISKIISIIILAVIINIVIFIS